MENPQTIIRNNSVIQGSVSPGFESVKELFIKEMSTKAENEAQLCIYHKGRRVVDLWATRSNDNTFTADSLINVFSSGKSLESLALASLVQKELLDYNEKISHYWPEFSSYGKSEITVADLMRHEAGLVDFYHTIDPEHLLTKNIKNNSIGKIIEDVQPRRSSNKANQRSYHAITRGWVANELFRRIDPDGRTIGEFIENDISKSLKADVYIGVDEENFKRRADVKGLGFLYHTLESFKPKFFGRRVEHSIGHSIVLFSPLVLSLITKMLRKKFDTRKNNESKLAVVKPVNADHKKKPIPLKGLISTKGLDTAISFFNQPIVAQGESSSFNASCSARGLSKIAAMMAAGGSFDDKEYFNKQTWETLHGNTTSAKFPTGIASLFSQGGLNHFTLDTTSRSPTDYAINKGREGFYGWMGLGGSIFQWHQKKEIGFAFIPTSLHLVDFFNERGKVYQAEVLRCVSVLNN